MIYIVILIGLLTGIPNGVHGQGREREGGGVEFGKF